MRLANHHNFGTRTFAPRWHSILQNKIKQVPTPYHQQGPPDCSQPHSRFAQRGAVISGRMVRGIARPVSGWSVLGSNQILANSCISSRVIPTSPWSTLKTKTCMGSTNRKSIPFPSDTLFRRCVLRMLILLPRQVLGLPTWLPLCTSFLHHPRSPAQTIRTCTLGAIGLHHGRRTYHPAVSNVRNTVGIVTSRPPRAPSILRQTATMYAVY